MSERTEVRNVDAPGHVTRVDATTYAAMREAIVRVLPERAPGPTRAEARAALAPLPPDAPWPGGAKAGWWAETVRLDPEARGLVERETTTPLRARGRVGTKGHDAGVRGGTMAFPPSPDTRPMAVPGFSQRWKDFPDYIVGITGEIWEGRGIETLNRYYAPDIPIRTPMGFARGNRGVMAATMATLHEFPDRRLYAEDVIWSGNPDTGFLSSHRIVTTGTHLGEGAFGPATGRRFTVRVVADCAARDGIIYDEWLVRDYGGIARQLGFEPKAHAASLIEREGGPDRCPKPFTPEIDEPGEYLARGNDDERGASYADTVTRLMGMEFDLVAEHYDRAVQGEYPGGMSTLSHEPVRRFWLGLRASFPDAEFRLHHVIGMPGGLLPPRAALRWSLDGVHDGRGAFGEPSGARVHVMGMAHAEFGPFVAPGSSRESSIRRECVVYDEIAIWKQILMQRPDLAGR